MIELAFPAGLWLGLAAAGVLVAHLVRRRARRRVVPFLPLWAAAGARQRGGVGASILRWLDLACVLLACAAVALAAAGPFLPGTPGTVRDLVLVLDGGVALRAGERASQVRKVALTEIRRRAAGTRFAVVTVTDDGAHVRAGLDAAGARSAVEEHRPGWTAADPGEALALGRQAAAGLADPDLVFVTHRDVPSGGYRLRAVRDPAVTAGIDSLEVLSDPEGGAAVARVGLRGNGAVTLRVAEKVAWSGDLEGARVVDVPLPPGRIVLRVAAARDTFAADDAAYVLLPERPAPRVLVVAEGQPSPFLAAALQALEGTGAVQGPLERTTPGRAAEAAGEYGLLVFDRCAPPETLAGTPALYLAPPPGALPFRVGAEDAAPALFRVEADHPLLHGFDLARMPPLRSRAIRGGETLASAAPGPALAAAPGWVALGFDPDRCVLAASPAYPLFLRNCVAWLAGTGGPSAAEFRAVGDPAPAEGVAEVEGTGPVRVEGRLLGPPGFWKLGDRDLAVSLLAKDLDLAPPARESDPLAEPGRPGSEARALAPLCAAAALALLLLAWWVFWRR